MSAPVGSPPLNEQTCRRCGAQFIGTFALCARCAQMARRLNEARETRAQADNARLHPFPPPRRPPRWRAR